MVWILSELLPVLDPSLEGTLKIGITSGEWIASLFLASLLDDLYELQVLGLEQLDAIMHLRKALLHPVIVHPLDCLDQVINWGHGHLVEVLLRETCLVQVESRSRVEPGPFEVRTNLLKDSLVELEGFELILVVLLIPFLPELDVVIISIDLINHFEMLAFLLLQPGDVPVDISVVVKGLPETSQPQKSSLLAVLNRILACSEHDHELLDAKLTQKVAVDGLSDGISIYPTVLFWLDFLDFSHWIVDLGVGHSTTTVVEGPSSTAAPATTTAAPSSIRVAAIRIVEGIDIILGIEFPLHVA